jgi:hypothetical protein
MSGRVNTTRHVGLCELCCVNMLNKQVVLGWGILTQLINVLFSNQDSREAIVPSAATP